MLIYLSGTKIVTVEADVYVEVDCVVPIHLDDLC